MELNNFTDLGKYVNIDGHNLFVIDMGADDLQEKEVMVIINGFPSISYDYHKVLLELSQYYRVIIHDHFGFGFSELPSKYCYSLIEQADVCIKLWTKMKLKKFSILANNYGTKVAQEVLFRYNSKLLPFKLNKVILSKNSNKLDYLNLLNLNKLIENKKLVRYREELTSRDNKGELENFEFKNRGLTEDDSKVHKIWNKFNDLHGQREILVASNFLDESYLYWHRWVKALKDSEIPVKIFWRKDDVQIKEIVVSLISNPPENVEFIENVKCFVMEDNPTQWLKMVMKNVNRTVYFELKNKYEVI